MPKASERAPSASGIAVVVLEPQIIARRREVTLLGKMANQQTGRWQLHSKRKHSTKQLLDETLWYQLPAGEIFTLQETIPRTDVVKANHVPQAGCAVITRIQLARFIEGTSRGKAGWPIPSGAARTLLPPRSPITIQCRASKNTSFYASINYYFAAYVVIKVSSIVEKLCQYSPTTLVLVAKFHSAITFISAAVH